MFGSPIKSSLWITLNWFNSHSTNFTVGLWLNRFLTPSGRLLFPNYVYGELGRSYEGVMGELWGSYEGVMRELWWSYREESVASWREHTVTLDFKLPNECEIGIRKCLNDINDIISYIKYTVTRLNCIKNGCRWIHYYRLQFRVIFKQYYS